MSTETEIVNPCIEKFAPVIVAETGLDLYCFSLKFFHFFRSDCNCTDTLGSSFMLSNSDCLFRVYRLFFSEKLSIKLYLKFGNSFTNLTEPCYLMEVNNRTDYYLTDTVLSNDGETAVSAIANTSITFEGSGLYHFEVVVARTDISFCNLKTEFIVFIDGAPFAHPAEDIVKAVTAIMFGAIILGVFLYYYYRRDEEEDE